MKSNISPTFAVVVSFGSRGVKEEEEVSELLKVKDNTIKQQEKLETIGKAMVEFLQLNIEE